MWFGADGDVRRGGVWKGMELEIVDRELEIVLLRVLGTVGQDSAR